MKPQQQLQLQPLAVHSSRGQKRQGRLKCVQPASSQSWATQSGARRTARGELSVCSCDAATLKPWEVAGQMPWREDCRQQTAQLLQVPEVPEKVKAQVQEHFQKKGQIAGSLS